MPWIESHDDLEEHPKLKNLASKMGWNKFEASGRLHAFWKWCLRYAPTGDLRRFNDTILADAAGVAASEAGKFVSAMTDVQSCWIDRGIGSSGGMVFRVHDWPSYTRKYLKESKFKDRPERWAEVETIYNESLQKNSGVDTEVSALPYLTLPTSTLTPSPPAPDRKRQASWPTLPEALIECDRGGGLKEWGEKFWNHFESTGWIDKNGHPIHNWKTKLTMWIANERSKKHEPHQRPHVKSSGSTRDDYTAKSTHPDQAAGLQRLRES